MYRVRKLLLQATAQNMLVGSSTLRKLISNFSSLFADVLAKPFRVISWHVSIHSVTFVCCLYQTLFWILEMKRQFQLIFWLLKLCFQFQHLNIKCLDVIVSPNFCQPLLSCANPNVDTHVHCCYALDIRCCCCSKFLFNSSPFVQVQISAFHFDGR